MVAAAAWLVVLAGYTAAPEVVMLTAVPARPRPEFDAAVGCLAQSLLVRVDLADDPRVEDVVGRVRDGLAEASRHQSYPFAEFGSSIAYPVEIPFSRWSPRTHFPGLVSEPYDLPHGLVWHWPLPGLDRGVPKLDLIGDRDGRLIGRLTYNRNAVDPATARGLAEQLRSLLVPGTGLDRRPSTLAFQEVR